MRQYLYSAKGMSDSVTNWLLIDRLVSRREDDIGRRARCLAGPRHRVQVRRHERVHIRRTRHHGS